MTASSARGLGVHDPRVAAIGLGPRSTVVLAVAALGSLVMFLWPLLIPAPPEGHSAPEPLLFALLLPVVVILVVAQLLDGGVDARVLAMLGVLTALNAALRALGAGTAGIETVFFLLVLAGRVYGPGFGYVLGVTTMVVSALLTGGVGPWLPFQMAAAAWVGLGAGLLPRARGKAEIALLVGYGIFAAYLFGFLMNLQFWPYGIGDGTELSVLPGAPVLENLRRFFLFTLATSAFGWDTGRAITNAIAITLIGTPALAALRRAVRRSAFTEPVEIEPPTSSSGRWDPSRQSVPPPQPPRS